MAMFGSRKVTFYKRLRLIRLLVRSLSDENLWVRYHAVQALDEIGSPRALQGLRKMLDEDKPGWWIEDGAQTMQELAPHYPGSDAIIDAMNNFNQGQNRALREKAEAAIAKIESKNN